MKNLFVLTIMLLLTTAAASGADEPAISLPDAAPADNSDLLIEIPDMTRFRISNGETLGSLLKQWAKQDGREYYAMTGQFSGALDYRFETSTGISNDLKEALEIVLRGVNADDRMRNAGVELSACLYEKGARTLLLKVNKNECP